MAQTHVAAGQPGLTHQDWRGDVKAAARVWAAVLLAGVVLGVVVVGVMSRLVMLLLASMNPVAAGVRSDDGFVMGQFTLSGSAQLAGAGGQIGAIAAFLYIALRGLMIGPPWFRLLSISVGPGVVVGSLLVHTDGVDFTLLEPIWLTIGSFVLIPVVFCAALHLVAEKAVRDGGVRSKPLEALGLLLAVVTFPLALTLGIGWWMTRQLRLREVHSTWLWAWTIRAVLALAFGLAIAKLVSDARTLSA